MSYQLTLEPLGATIEVEEGQTILDAALRQGIYIPHACGWQKFYFDSKTKRNRKLDGNLASKC